MMKSRSMLHALALLALASCFAASAQAQASLFSKPTRAITGAPFSAVVEVDWTGLGSIPPGTREMKVWRDREGRVRSQTDAGNKVSATVYDVVTGQAERLNQRDQTAITQPWQPAAPPLAWDVTVHREAPCNSAGGSTGLGSKQIAGLDACGEATTARESWHSIAYGLQIVQIYEDPTRGHITQRLVSFVPGEPDPTLFQVPADYKVQQESARPASSLQATHRPSAPRILDAPEPEYSKEGRSHKIAGNVLVALTVGEDGKPRDLRVIRGLGYGLDEKALQAVSRYKFKPATQDGVPVAVQMNVQVNFQIF